jgi:putative membrane protein
MADVNIETAGGQGAEASLSVLSKAEAERLRAAVFEQASLARHAAGAEPRTPIELESRVIRALSVRELVVAGLTSNQMASVLAILAIAFSVVEDVLPQDSFERTTRAIGRFVEQFAQQGIAAHWIQLLVAILGLMLVGVAFSVVGSILMFYGFTLSRKGEDLHRTYGLLTRRASSLPRRRIQLLKIEEKLLRRLFGLATMRADTAGSRPQRSDEGSGGRDVLLPAVPRSEIESMLPEFFPDLEPGNADWRRVSKRAIWRGTWKGGFVCVVLAAVFWSVKPEWMNLWPLALLPLVFVLNVMSYRYLGYSLGTTFFRTRRGWLSRATHIVPIRNAQAIVLRQTPLDRRHRVASLIVDTAGQAYTGGAPRIDNVPQNDALDVARTLAHRAAQTRYQWHRS